MAPSGSNPADNMPRAMAWMAFSGVCFALMGAMVKLSGPVALTTKVFFRNLVTLAITGGVACHLRQNPLAATPHWRQLVLRSLCGLLGVLLYFHALSRLALADASLLNKTSPFFVTIFAVVILKERFNRALVPALLAAMTGAALVIKPSFDLAALPAVAGLGSGLFAGLAYVLVRGLRGRETPNRIILTFSLVSCVAMLPWLFLHPPHPTGLQWGALLGTGLFAAGGQYGLTFAYHHARASRITVFTYLHVVFAGLLGYLFWGEILDPASLVGGALIVGAAAWTHRVARQST